MRLQCPDTFQAVWACLDSFFSICFVYLYVLNWSIQRESDTSFLGNIMELNLILLRSFAHFPLCFPGVSSASIRSIGFQDIITVDVFSLHPYKRESKTVFVRHEVQRAV